MRLVVHMHTHMDAVHGTHTHARALTHMHTHAHAHTLHIII